MDRFNLPPTEETAPAEKIAEALPAIYMNRRLADAIESFAQVQALSDEELRVLRAMHGQEILAISQRIANRKLKGEPHGALQYARGKLAMHCKWLDVESKERHIRAELQAKQIKRETREVTLRAQKESQERKRAIRQIERDENLRQFEVFKAVVKETLGEPTYRHLWATAQQRLATQPGG